MESIASDQRSNLVGALCMIGSMAAFAVEDAFIKAAAETLPTGQILVLFGLGGSLVFAGLAGLDGRPLYHPDVVCGAMRARVVFEIAGRLFYTLAITLIPLSTATVILQATPLFVVAGAALVFGEAVGWRRWSAVGLGLLGVLVIVQPGAEDFSGLSILAVIGMLGFAGRDLASRAAPRSLSNTILGLYGFLAVLVAGAIFSVWEGAPFVVPRARTSLCLGGAVVVGVAAYALLMRAMRMGDVSAVTPFRYTRLLFGAALGVALFEERLSGAMVAGSALVVMSGLFIVWRGRRERAPV